MQSVRYDIIISEYDVYISDVARVLNGNLMKTFNRRLVDGTAYVLLMTLWNSPPTIDGVWTEMYTVTYF